MSQLNRKKLAGVLALGLAGQAAMGGAPAAAQGEAWDVSGFVENATHLRDDVGLSKFRNTAQIELYRDFDNTGPFSSFSINATLRATYDGVYDLNSGDFGDDSGDSVLIRGVGVPADVLGPGAPAVPEHFTPYGQSILSNGSFFLGFDTEANPNEGLALLGSQLHGQDGVVLAYPTRPCDVDSRGCIADYLDYNTDELRFPEFNDHLDFVRELYVDAAVPVGAAGRELGVRLGKQQVVWGRTDLFRVLDVLNPVDYSRHNIYDELEDIRIPQWMLNTELRLGSVGAFSDLNFAVVWNFDEFRPHNLGQGGTPYSILDAGSFFRAMNVCWEVGCTVGNFAGGGVTTDFAPGQIGIRQANLPDWKFDNTQYGLKVEGLLGDLGFSLNYVEYFSQLPSLRAGVPAQNSFTGETGVWPHLISFDIEFPRIQLYGGSLDLYVDQIETVLRIETAYSTGEEFPNTAEERLFSESDVLRYVVGLDKNIFLPGLDTNSSALVSFQLFGQHILDHVRNPSAGSEAGVTGFGPIGMPDWKDNWTATLLVRQPFKNGLINPQIIMAHDFRANATVFAPSIEWLASDHWRITLGANIKTGDGAREFDDCRTCNPFPPFTATGLHADPLQSGSVGLYGYEPLGRFRSGPIGMAQEEDELQMTVRYRF